MEKNSIKKEVLDTIILIGHATIEDIFLQLKVKNPSITKKQIYHNISELKKEKLISATYINGFPKLYEVNKGTHNHFVCKECGKIININAQIVIPQNMVDGNKVEEITLVVYGVCSDCNKNKLVS